MFFHAEFPVFKQCLDAILI